MCVCASVCGNGSASDGVAFALRYGRVDISLFRTLFRHLTDRTDRPLRRCLDKFSFYDLEK